MINEKTSIEQQCHTLQHVTNNLLIDEGAHIVYVFNEHEKYVGNSLTFLSEGLDNREHIILVEDENFYITIKRLLKLQGYSEEEIQLISYYRNSDYYLPKKDFNIDIMMAKLEELLKGINETPSKRTRIWGQVLVLDSSISEIKKYEKAYDNLMYGKNIISVCSYNGLTMPAFFQNELLKIHQYIMLDDQIEKSPFYNRKNVSDTSNSEIERLQLLQQENTILKEKYETLLINSATQKEREKFLKMEKINAEKENSAKNLFLSQMSHDLRTPLNTIQGYAQIILMNEYKREHLNEKIKKIYNASEHLLKLIEEILDFTSIDTGSVKINKEAVQLKPFLEECVSSLMDITTSNITIELEDIDDTIWIEVDPLRFNQIMTNLLDNAIKYNNAKGIVKIYCDYDEKNKDITINVKDTGIGIGNEDLHLIFDPFYRTKKSERKSVGTGLGLAIVAQLTKRMDGKYGIFTEEGIGSTFWVSFKRSKRKELSDKCKKNGKIASTSLNKATSVLYIEDNLDNIEVMKGMLHEIGNVDLTSVTTGEKGIKQAFDIHPAIILLDLSLPDIHGYEVLNKLKSNPITKNIPIVAVSADALQSTIKQALVAGCSAYITKPINFEELTRVIERILEPSKQLT
ncbi:ATP-binding protein [Evansella sp. AB-P1]|uniref:ATP-binding protein n=1 Tax=Evansella sp. AB-P1 TaxID=3037653 RepID=UPI00241C4E4B|nr:ATP-binding protein [Evansella sp. AB-P1]MDG5789229.1 ATP-binding protein [Evansella sp. AB-P1]